MTIVNYLLWQSQNFLLCSFQIILGIYQAKFAKICISIDNIIQQNEFSLSDEKHSTTLSDYLISH